MNNASIKDGREWRICYLSMSLRTLQFSRVVHTPSMYVDSVLEGDRGVMEFDHLDILPAVAQTMPRYHLPGVLLGHRLPMKTALSVSEATAVVLKAVNRPISHQLWLRLSTLRNENSTEHTNAYCHQHA